MYAVVKRKRRTGGVGSNHAGVRHLSHLNLSNTKSNDILSNIIQTHFSSWFIPTFLNHSFSNEECMQFFQWTLSILLSAKWKSTLTRLRLPGQWTWLSSGNLTSGVLFPCAYMLIRFLIICTSGNQSSNDDSLSGHQMNSFQFRILCSLLNQLRPTKLFCFHVCLYTCDFVAPDLCTCTHAHLNW